MDKIRAYYTEWIRSERKTPVQYTNAYMWNLEGFTFLKKWYKHNQGKLCWTVSGSHPLLGILNTLWWTLCGTSSPSQLSCYFYLFINKETVRGLNDPIWHGLWEAGWVLKTKFLQIGKPVACLIAHFVQKILKSLMEFRTLKISGSHWGTQGHWAMFVGIFCCCCYNEGALLTFNG